MPEIFPSGASVRPHNWSTVPTVPERPFTKKDYSGGGSSRLIFSAIAVKSEVTFSWDNGAEDFLPGWEMQVLREFSAKVGTHTSFTLPVDFWPDAVPYNQKQSVLNASPTGYWMLKEAPKIDRVYEDRWTVLMTFISVID